MPNKGIIQILAIDQTGANCATKLDGVDFYSVLYCKSNSEALWQTNE